MPGKIWTPVEKIVLRGYYRDYPVLYWAHLLSGRTEKAIRTKARRMGLFVQRDRRLYCVNDYYFTNLTPEKCYWGGFLAADGCIDDSKNGQLVLGLKLHEKDIHHVRALRDLLAPNKPISQTGCFAGLCVSSDRIAADLKRHFNITPRKSLILQPPNNIRDEDLIFAYIAGYFDGDGNVQEGRKLKFVAGTPSVLVWIKEKIRAVKYGDRVSACVHQIRTKGSCFSYCVGTGRVWHFVEKVKDMGLPLLERKWGQLVKSKTGYDKSPSKRARNRQVRAWKLRQEGLPYQEIAGQLDYATRGSARHAVLAIQKISARQGFSSAREFIEASGF